MSCTTLLLIAVAVVPPAAITVERHAAAMGTVLTLAATARDRPTALAASEAALRAVAAAEDRLSTWRADTELARLNAATVGVWQPLSPALEHDLRRAAALTAASGGAFHLGMAGLVAAWDLRGVGRVPSPAELRAALPTGALGGLELDAGRARWLSPAAGVEEGGFGKGVALAAATSAALATGADSVVADLGGQLALAGSCAPTDIDLAHPAQRERAVARLSVAAGSLATSGGSERSLVVDGRRVHHVLDPRSGLPAAFTGSATVLDRDPVTADALATALVVMGWDEGRRWLAGQPDVEAVLALSDGDSVRLAATPTLAAALAVLHRDVALELIPRAPINGSNPAP